MMMKIVVLNFAAQLSTNNCDYYLQQKISNAIIKFSTCHALHECR